MDLQNLKAEIISPEAAEFLISLHEKFDNLRRHLLMKRKTLAKQLNHGAKLQQCEYTRDIREADWTVAKAPRDLNDRRVEITGPAEPKMIINALNSGAKVFMADFEDSLSPTWKNILLGQVSLKQAVRRTLQFQSENGKVYSLNQRIATLVVRPRGLHLEEKNFQIRGQAISASLFDFGLYFYHNVHELLRRESGPYFYLPKLENHEEAKWWNDVFDFAQDRLKIPRGTIRATVLIETITAAFEMDEILYALKDHASGLNAGRWDYIFSLIKKFHARNEFITSDRQQITMITPFMEAYCRRLVQTCHKRQAHAIGGMSAFIPTKHDHEINRTAMQNVSLDKEREARMGFDGTWVAHPDLIFTAEAQFAKILKLRPHQKEVLPSMEIHDEDLLALPSSQGKITEQGVRTNINISLLYLDRWFSGAGAVALYNLMEDAATVEISRSQLWQWLHHSVKLSDGRILTSELYFKFLQEEVSKLISQNLSHLDMATSLLNSLVLSDHFPDFLTIEAYEILNQLETKGATYDFEQRATVTPVGI